MKNKETGPFLHFGITTSPEGLEVEFNTIPAGLPVTGEDLIIQLSMGIWLTCKEIADQAGIPTMTVWKDIRTIIDFTGDDMSAMIVDDPDDHQDFLGIPPGDLN
jgi:hypothetical protein